MLCYIKLARNCFSLFCHGNLHASGRRWKTQTLWLPKSQVVSFPCSTARAAKPSGFFLPSSSPPSLPKSMGNVASYSNFAFQSHFYITPLFTEVSLNDRLWEQLNRLEPGRWCNPNAVLQCFESMSTCRSTSFANLEFFSCLSKDCILLNKMLLPLKNKMSGIAEGKPAYTHPSLCLYDLKISPM